MKKKDLNFETIAKVLILSIAVLLIAVSYFFTNKPIPGRSKTKAAVLEKKPDETRALADKKQNIKAESIVFKSKKALTVISDKDKEVEELIVKLKNENLEINQAAAENLVKLGRIAVPKLIETLKESDLALKGQVIFLLGRIRDKEAAPIIMETLKDENAYIRRNSAESLGKIKAEESLSALYVALFDEDAGVRERSAWSIGELNDHRGIISLIDRIDDEKEERVKIAIVDAFGKLEDLRSTALLLKELKSKSSQSYKNKIIAVLGQIGDRKALVDLAEYLDMLKKYKPTNEIGIYELQQAMEITEEAIRKIQKN